ncbi:hypothetical protein [Streptomyces phaeochromogenes]
MRTPQVLQDEYAVQQRLQILEDSDDNLEIAVLTLRPERAKDALRRALSISADKAIHVEDDDPLGTTGIVQTLIAEHLSEPAGHAAARSPSRTVPAGDHLLVVGVGDLADRQDDLQQHANGSRQGRTIPTSAAEPGPPSYDAGRQAVLGVPPSVQAAPSTRFTSAAVLSASPARELADRLAWGHTRGDYVGTNRPDHGKSLWVRSSSLPGFSCIVRYDRSGEPRADGDT